MSLQQSLQHTQEEVGLLTPLPPPLTPPLTPPHPAAPHPPPAPPHPRLQGESAALLLCRLSEKQDRCILALSAVSCMHTHLLEKQANTYNFYNHDIYN